MAAIECTGAFHRYCEHLHCFVVTGEQRDVGDALRHAVVILARAERWTPSVILKAVRGRCYPTTADPDAAARYATEIDRLLYLYYTILPTTTLCEAVDGPSGIP